MKLIAFLRGPLEGVFSLAAGGIPEPQVKMAAKRPLEKSKALTEKACAKAAAVSGSLQLPVGPLGFMTILPDLAAVWRIQSQLVVDIAAAYGHKKTVSQDEMMTCLFKHVADTAQREYAKGVPIEHEEPAPTLLDYVDKFTRPDGRALSVKVGRELRQMVVKRTVKRMASRVLPMAGAAIVSAYAALDTKEVARTAVELFSGETLPARKNKKNYPSPEEMFQLNSMRDIQSPSEGA